MDDRYREIYASIYSARTEQYGGFEPRLPLYVGVAGPQGSIWREVVRESINAAERAISIPLREDGKALLAVNFEELVILPLALGGRIGDPELFSDVREDIGMLVRDAAVRAGDSGEVSAHKVIDALSDNWPNLRTNRFSLWDTE